MPALLRGGQGWNLRSMAKQHMTLDPLQLDYRRLAAQERRQDRLMLWVVLPLCVALAALAGLGMALVLYYLNHP